MIDIKKVIDDIKNQIRAEEVKNKIASDLCLKLDKSNKCLCFNHNEKVPSMSFDMKAKKFRCFSCAYTYDIFNHYQEYYNKSFIEAIRDFIKMRSTIKKPLTDRALKGILNKLDAFATNDLDKVEILENSIMNCWQSVFELKNKKAPVGAGTQKNNLVNPNICNNDEKYTRGVKML